MHLLWQHEETPYLDSSCCRRNILRDVSFLHLTMYPACWRRRCDCANLRFACCSINLFIDKLVVLCGPQFNVALRGCPYAIELPAEHCACNIRKPVVWCHLDRLTRQI